LSLCLNGGGGYGREERTPCASACWRVCVCVCARFLFVRVLLAGRRGGSRGRARINKLCLPPSVRQLLVITARVLRGNRGPNGPGPRRRAGRTGVL